MHTEELPAPLIDKAIRFGREFGWRLADFPAVLDAAAGAGFACIGGQFEWMFTDGIYEAYWLNADSDPQSPGEAWEDYVERARLEVLRAFESLTIWTDFEFEATAYEFLRSKIASGVDLAEHLVFVTYFERRPQDQ